MPRNVSDYYGSMSKRQRMSLTFSIVLAVGVLLIGVAVYFLVDFQDYKTYVNKQIGLKMQYPSNWSVDKSQQGTVVVFVSPKENDLDTFRENVSIIVQDLSQRPMSLKRYTAVAIEQIAAVFKQHIAIDANESTALVNMPAHKFVYHEVGEDRALGVKFMHIWTIKSDVAYQITYGALMTSYDKYLPQVKAMIRSFEITR